MNLMKLTRRMLAVLGFSTVDFHNNLPLLSNPISKVIPTPKEEDLLAKVEKDFQRVERILKLTIIPFGKDDFPTLSISKNNKRSRFVYPKSIKPTRIVKYPQSRHGRR